MTKYKCPECGWENFRNVVYGVVLQCTKCKTILHFPLDYNPSCKPDNDAVDQFMKHEGYLGGLTLIVEEDTK